MIIAYKERSVEHSFHEVSFIDAKTIAAFGILLLIFFGIFFRLGLIQTQGLWQIWGGGLTLPSNIFGTIMVATVLVIVVYSIMKE